MTLRLVMGGSVAACRCPDQVTTTGGAANYSPGGMATSSAANTPATAWYSGGPGAVKFRPLGGPIATRARLGTRPSHHGLLYAHPSTAPLTRAGVLRRGLEAWGWDGEVARATGLLWGPPGGGNASPTAAGAANGVANGAANNNAADVVTLNIEQAGVTQLPIESVTCGAPDNTTEDGRDATCAVTITLGPMVPTTSGVMLTVWSAYWADFFNWVRWSVSMRALPESSTYELPTLPSETDAQSVWSTASGRFLPSATAVLRGQTPNQLELSLVPTQVLQGSGGSSDNEGGTAGELLASGYTLEVTGSTLGSAATADTFWGGGQDDDDDGTGNDDDNTGRSAANNDEVAAGVRIVIARPNYMLQLRLIDKQGVPGFLSNVLSVTSSGFAVGALLLSLGESALRWFRNVQLFKRAGGFAYERPDACQPGSAPLIFDPAKARLVLSRSASREFATSPMPTHGGTPKEAFAPPTSPSGDSVLADREHAIVAEALARERRGAPSYIDSIFGSVLRGPAGVASANISSLAAQATIVLPDGNDDEVGGIGYAPKDYGYGDLDDEKENTGDKKAPAASDAPAAAPVAGAANVALPASAAPGAPAGAESPVLNPQSSAAAAPQPPTSGAGPPAPGCPDGPAPVSAASPTSPPTTAPPTTSVAPASTTAVLAPSPAGPNSLVFTPKPPGPLHALAAPDPADPSFCQAPSTPARGPPPLALTAPPPAALVPTSTATTTHAATATAFATITLTPFTLTLSEHPDRAELLDGLQRAQAAYDEQTEKMALVERELSALESAVNAALAAAAATSSPTAASSSPAATHAVTTPTSKASTSPTTTNTTTSVAAAATASTERPRQQPPVPPVVLQQRAISTSATSADSPTSLSSSAAAATAMPPPSDRLVSPRLPSTKPPPPPPRAITPRTHPPPLPPPPTPPPTSPAPGRRRPQLPPPPPPLSPTRTSPVSAPSPAPASASSAVTSSTPPPPAVSAPPVPAGPPIPPPLSARRAAPSQPPPPPPPPAVVLLQAAAPELRPALEVSLAAAATGPSAVDEVVSTLDTALLALPSPSPASRHSSASPTPSAASLGDILLGRGGGGDRLTSGKGPAATPTTVTRSTPLSAASPTGSGGVADITGAEAAVSSAGDPPPLPGSALSSPAPSFRRELAGSGIDGAGGGDGRSTSSLEREHQREVVAEALAVLPPPPPPPPPLPPPPPPQSARRC